MTETATVVETTEIAILEPRDVTAKNIELMLTQVKEIPDTPEDKKQYETVKGMHIQIKKILPKIEARRKEIKKGPLMVCNLIDANAKKAASMVQPLLLATNSRRKAWEGIVEKERAVAQETEQARLKLILTTLKDLKSGFDDCLEYNVSAQAIKVNLQRLKDYHVSETLFQEYFGEAQTIHKKGLLSANTAFENRLKFEAERSMLEADRKAQAEARAKIDADQKAEAERLTKIAADQKAAAAKAEAKQEERDRKAWEAQEAVAQELADERAAFEAEKVTMAKAEIDRIVAKKKRKENKSQEKAKLEAGAEKAARIAISDALLAEALPLYRKAMCDRFMPEALDINTKHDQLKREAMDVAAQRSMDIMRDRNAIEKMTDNIRDILDFDLTINIPEIKELVVEFSNEVDTMIFDLNLDIEQRESATHR